MTNAAWSSNEMIDDIIKTLNGWICPFINVLAFQLMWKTNAISFDFLSWLAKRKFLRLTFIEDDWSRASIFE